MLPFWYWAPLPDKCMSNRTWDLMKGASPNIHRLSSLRLPWCCCFAFLSNFKLLILSSRFRVCHSLLFQHTKQTDKLLPQKQHFFVLVCFFFYFIITTKWLSKMACEWKGYAWGEKKGNIWRREWGKNSQTLECPRLESVSCPLRISIPVFAWALCNTINEVPQDACWTGKASWRPPCHYL